MWRGEEWEMEGDSAEIVTEVSVEPRHLDMVHLGFKGFLFHKITQRSRGTIQGLPNVFLTFY